MTVYPIMFERYANRFGVTFPDFPGCVTGGFTVEEAFKNAHDALALHIKGMKEDGIPMPKPTGYANTSFNALMGETVMLIMVET